MYAKSKLSKIFVVLIAVVFMLSAFLVTTLKSTIVLAAPHYAYSIDKMVTGITNPDTTDGGSVVDEVGDAISYQIAVENTGIGGGPKPDLSQVTLYDSLIGGYLGSPDAGDVDGDEWLDNDEIWYWYYTYTATQTDIDINGDGNGYIDNTATVNCDQLDPQSDSAEVPVYQDPAVEMEKTVDPTSVSSPSDVTYSYNVTNTGNVTLTGLSLDDDKAGAITLGATTLAPGATTTGTATYSIIQAMVDAGDDIIDVATVTSDQGAYDMDSATVTISQNPTVDLDKTVDPTSVSAPGNVTYSYTVTNTGNVTLTGLLLDDDKVGAIALDATTLDPGDSTTGTATYAITQAMIDAGDDIVSVTTVTSDQGAEDTDTATVTISIQTTPGTQVILKICPCPLEEHDIYPGDRLVLTIKEVNTGDEPLSNVSVTLSPGGYRLVKGDTYYHDGDTNNDGILDPGETWIWFIVGVEVEHDVIFKATGHGWSSNLEEDITYPKYPDERDSVYVNVIGTKPALSIIKSGTWVDGDGDGYADVGEIINYTFSVTNKGNVTLNNVTVTDPKLTVVGGPIVLDVGETDTITFTGTYTITQADLEAGYVDNTAKADSHESGPASDDDTVELPTITIQTNPDTTATLVASAYTVYSGGTVALTITEENTGDDPLTNPYVWVGRLDPATGLVITPGWAMGKNDPHYVSGDKNNDGILDPGETWTWKTPEVEIVGDGVIIIAKGHGIDSLDNDVAWPEYPGERDIVAVNTITTQTTPDTQIRLNICRPKEEYVIYPVDMLTMTISETNSGDIAINNPYVWLGGIDPLTGIVIDLSIADTGANGWAMGKDDPQYVDGDTNDDGVLDPGETWVWKIIDVEVNEDVSVIAKGHGSVSGVEGDIAYPDYPNERDKVYVEVMDDI